MRSLLDGVRHAGSVFVGPFSPEAAGDYASGPNHVLPTSGAARQRGGLAVTDFLKVISVQELSAAALGDWRRPSPRWRAPRAWRRTRARWRRRVGERRRMKLPKLPKGAIRPRPAVVAMAPYSPPTAGRADKLRLDFNENTVGCSPRVIAALREGLDAAQPGHLSRIRRGQGGHGRATSTSRPSSSSSPTAPTKPSRSSSTPMWTTGRRCCCSSPPTPCTASMRRWRARRSRRSITRSPAWSFRSQEVLDAITPETRAVILANPNNPTGTGISLLAHRAPSAPRAQGRGAGGRGLLRIRRRDRADGDRARPQPVREPHVLEGFRNGRHAGGLPVLARGQRRAACTRRNRRTA